MKAALYARVSTAEKDQNPEVQLSSLRELCQGMGWEIYQEFVDQASALDMANRVAWRELLGAAARHRFDVLVVWKLDRAFRSVMHAATTLKQLQGYQVGFKSYTEPFIDTTTPQGEFIFHVMAANADLERQILIQRVQAGVKYARTHGTKSGRPIGRPRIRMSQVKIYDAFYVAEGNYSEAGRLLGVSAGFVFNRIQRGKFTPEQIIAGEFLHKISRGNSDKPQGEKRSD